MHRFEIFTKTCWDTSLDGHIPGALLTAGRDCGVREWPLVDEAIGIRDRGRGTAADEPLEPVPTVDPPRAATAS